MPVRSLRSSVFKWPDDRVVRRAVTRWAAEMGAQRDTVLSIGYVGSYTRQRRRFYREALDEVVWVYCRESVDGE